jgi:ABC-type transport system involved in multi-copper enzyme maturation permease subunit
MNTLIKKEIRLLLPAWVAAMVLAVVPTFIVWGVLGFDSTQLGPEPAASASFVATFMPFIFALGVLLLGISSFGQELNSGCFGALLSQPAERRRIWSVKVITLAIAFVSVLLTAIIIILCVFAIWSGEAFHAYQRHNLESFESEALEFLTLSALVTFSGGLWTTLLFRQTAGAFWFTLLSPLAIIMGLSTILPDWVPVDEQVNHCIVAALVLYSIAGFFLAWRLFMRAQDVQWASGEVSLPWRGKMSGVRIISLSSRTRSWLPTLILKEIQLHQASLVIAVVLLVLHLACIVTHRIHRHFGPDPEFILETFWTLWLLMPLLIGATAIAEERRTGTIESQLCAPVSRRAQFFIKFSVALVLSLILGAATPLVIQGIHAPNEMIHLVKIAAGIFFIAFYASSLARTTLQAMGLTVVVAAVIIFYEASPWFSSFGDYPHGIAGIELLKYYLSVPILLFVLAGMASWNFRWLHQNRRLQQRNAIAMLVACASITILANAIYYRPWELLMPSEPRGPVRIHNTAEIKFESTFQNGIYSLSPDHRLWVEAFAYYEVPDSRQATGSSMVTVFSPNLCHGQFIGGSNWVDFAVNDYATVAIQSDGTLWAIQCKAAPFNYGKTPPASFILKPIGTDTNWSRVTSGQDGFLLLKNDGSLWRWGTRIYICPKGSQNPPVKLDVTSLPVRVADQTNWTGFYSSGFLPYARNSDGNNWILMGKHIVQETNVDNQWSTLRFGDDLSYVEIKTNGELWYCSSVAFHHTRKIQLGQDMKWKAAMYGAFGMMRTITAIRSDGTLWIFQVHWGGNYPSSIPTQLGHRSDWVALASGYPMGSGYAQASDGSIWDFEPRSSYAWLAPSRRPLNLGNIFQGTESSQKP